MKKPIIFLDHKNIHADDNLLKLLTPGILPYRGVFETMRVYQGKVFAFKEHMARMKKGCRLLKIKMPLTAAKIEFFIAELLRLNRFKNARLRVSIWEKRKHVHVAIVVTPFVPLISKKLRATVSTYHQDFGRTSSIKSLDYEHFYNAFLEAKQNGFDEAILLNNRGEVVESARANIFIIKDKIIFTPRLSSGCLEGVTRCFVMNCAKGLNIPVKESAVKLNQLLEADEVFLTNSIQGLMPLTRVNHLCVGKGSEGALTKRLKKEYHILVKNALQRKSL